MQQIQLHPKGPHFSRIIYGVWRWDENQQSLHDARLLVDTALEAGIDTFDHADIYNDYNNEIFFGKLLAEDTGLRDRIKIITKCGIRLKNAKWPSTAVKHYDYTAEHIRSSVETSLKNLRTDRIELLLLHRPSPLLDVRVVADTLELLVEEGKLQHIGVSNFTPSQFDLLQSALGIPLVTNQIELSLLHHAPLTDGSIDHAYRLGHRPLIWSPLAGGKLFSDNSPLREKLNKVAAVYGIGADTLALAWLLRHPAGVLPIVGTNRAERIASAAAAIEVELAQQDWFRVYEAALGQEVP